MASYLAFFALGRFQVERGTRNGVPYFLAVSKRLGDGAQASAMRLMRRTSAITAFLAQRVGRYPFESTGGLVTSLDVGFALENQTRPTYPVVSEHDAYLLVHELAHQWFGNAVSVRRWRDIWLNEGLATFFEVVHDAATGGQSARRWLREYYDAYRGDAGFWRLNIADPGPGRIFADQVYFRGAMAAQALRNRVGERAFWRILRTWVRERHDGVGTSPDFEALAERVSGRQLDGFFDAWLRAPRPPARTRANGLGG
jgi:aminopeptidase N